MLVLILLEKYNSPSESEYLRPGQTQDALRLTRLARGHLLVSSVTGTSASYTATVMKTLVLGDTIDYRTSVENRLALNNYNDLHCETICDTRDEPSPT